MKYIDKNRSSGPSRRKVIRLAAFGAAGILAAPYVLRSAYAQDNLVLQPFDPGAPSGAAPTDLPKAAAYLSVDDNELFLGIGNSIRQSVEARGLQYLTSTYGGDTAKFVEQFEGFLARAVGAFFIIGTDPEATRPLQQRALDVGIFLQGMILSYVHQVVDINQYEAGRVQGEAAAEWIRTNLGGKAQIVNFNEKEVEVLKPRYQAIIDAVKAVGEGVEIVADITAPRNTQGGMEAMNSILQAHPGVNVVLGSAGVISGAYAAFDALGRTDEAEIYLSGISPGKADLDLVRKGKIYRAGIVQPFELWAYAGGQSAADWLEGKSVPQGLTSDSFVVSTPDQIDLFQADMANPAATWADNAKRDKYVRQFGNITYATRDKYVARHWAPT